jgi:hypothetical protein
VLQGAAARQDVAAASPHEPVIVVHLLQTGTLWHCALCSSRYSLTSLTRIRDAGLLISWTSAPADTAVCARVASAAQWMARTACWSTKMWWLAQSTARRRVPHFADAFLPAAHSPCAT